MLPEYYNTFIAEMCHMTDVTDEDILNHAVAEVTRVEDDDDDANISNDAEKSEERNGVSLLDEVFRNDPEMAVGYIRLPAPVVNINYLFGAKPILPKLLKKSREDLENLVYYTVWAVTSSSDPERFPSGTILTNKELETAQTDAQVEVVSGADAIAFLMKQAGIENNGILHEVIPVPPLNTRERRFVCEKAGTFAYSPLPLERSLGSMVMRSNRVRRLMEMGAPEIIIRNERRILQEYVDALICNGARRGLVKLGYDGIPWFSLRDEYCCITKGHMDYLIKVDLDDLPKERILKLAQKIRQADTDEFDWLENGTDDTYIDENGEEKHICNESDPKHTRKAIEERYHTYKSELSELKELCRPTVDRFLHEKYAFYQAYFEAAENLIGEAIERWTRCYRKHSDYLQQIGYIISSVSYVFFVNGTPFYTVPEDSEKAEDDKKAEKEGLAHE